jgi:uncharacterized CHY-type Zn-finger protein
LRSKYCLSIHARAKSLLFEQPVLATYWPLCRQYFYLFPLEKLHKSTYIYRFAVLRNEEAKTMAHLLVCDNCKQKFVAARQDERFCSPKCRKQFRELEAREARALWRRSGLERQLIEERGEQQQ